jgi:hypothetical protein
MTTNARGGTALLPELTWKFTPYRAGAWARTKTPASVPLTPPILSAVTGSPSTTIPRRIVITMYRLEKVTTNETGR